MNELARLIADVAVEAVAHAERHGDTQPLVRLFTVIPQKMRWEYVKLIQTFSPLRIGAKREQVFAKLHKPEDPQFRPFSVGDLVVALQEHPHSRVTQPQGQYSSKLKVLNDYLSKSKPKKLPTESELKKEALLALAHAQAHGDTRLVANLVSRLPEAYWEYGFRRWLYAHSPIRKDPKSGTFKQAKNDSAGYRDYDLSGAASTPILEDGKPHNIRDILRDDTFLEWSDRLPEASHSELLAAYRSYVESATSSRLRGIETVNRVFDAVEAEWGRRMQANDYFVWPKIGGVMRGGAPLDGFDAPQLGIYAALGYRVGKIRGQPTEVRLFLLDRIFARPLPPLNDPEYMQKWGRPEKAMRLRTMAYFLAHEIENASRRVAGDYGLAISQWTADLDYLYERYYVGYFKFGWPSNKR